MFWIEQCSVEVMSSLHAPAMGEGNAQTKLGRGTKWHAMEWMELVDRQDMDY